MMVNLIRNLYVNISALLLYALIVSINRTLRLKIIGGGNFYNLKQQNRNIIFAFWHAATFIPIYHYKNKNACILTALSLRGDVLTKVAEKLGYQVVRLLPRREGVRGVKTIVQLISLIKKGYDSNIAVDGPDGPAFKVKPGVIYVARQTGYPILPVGSAASPALKFGLRWDKYFVPLPWSRACIVLGTPIFLETGGLKDENEVLNRCQQLTETLNQLTELAKKEV